MHDNVRSFACRTLAVNNLISGINFLVLPVDLIPAPLSLSCLFMLLPHSSHCHLTTLTIRNSLSLSLRPISFTNLSHDRLPSSLRIYSTDFTTGSFLLSVSVFSERERELTFTFAICYRPPICLSVCRQIFGNISTALGTFTVH